MINKIGMLIPWLCSMIVATPILFSAINEVIKEGFNFPKRYAIPLLILFIIGCLIWLFAFCLIFFIIKYWRNFYHSVK